jgi:acyl-CoA dehydrogenase
MTPSLDEFRDTVRAFIDREVAPHADAWTRERSVPRSLFRAAGEAGLLGLKYGATRRPYAFTRVMLDELGRSGLMGCLLPLVLQSEFATPHLALYGGPELQRRFLEPAIAGTCVVAIAMTEPEGGSELAALRTTATPIDDGYRVSGRKWMIGNGSLADVVLVVCRAEQTGELPRATMIAVERSDLRVIRQLDKTGLHATPNCELAFDCFVPAANVLGRPGLALPQGLIANAYERVALAVLATGAMRAGWELAVRFLSERGLLDRSPWRHRLTQDHVAMLGVERLVADAAASLDDKPDVPLVLAAKIAATETCQQVLAHAAQAHGARGFLAEERIGRLQADARALTIGGGATEALIDALSRVVLRKEVR